MRLGQVAMGYAWMLGAGLLLEGAGLLLLDGLRVAMPSLGFAVGDALHNALHAAWGAAILVALAMRRTEGRAFAVLLVFGVFYVCLGVLGLVVDRPFGLQLGPGENVFHLTVGPLALLLGAWGTWTRRRRLATSTRPA